MQIENRTPHAVQLFGADGSSRILEPVRPPVRLELRPGSPEAVTADGVTVHAPCTVHGVSGLPEPRPGVLILVSQLAALGISFLHPDRTDVVHPNNQARHGVRRDRDGIIGISGVVRVG